MSPANCDAFALPTRSNHLGVHALPCYNRWMHLTQLALVNFRNYAGLVLDLGPGPLLLCGDNAQGKTNLLEAVYFLATTRSTFARAERQVINWQSLEHDALPFARLEGHVQRQNSAFRIDVTLLPNEAGRIHKEMRLNGVKKRALDLVGQLNAVLFIPEDIDLVTGAPAARRRYLDITLCQIEPTYCRALSRYNQTLTQRNALLKQLGERQGNQDQLVYWDEQLAEQCALLIVSRREAIAALDRLGRERYRVLSDQGETLRLYYAPSFDPEDRPSLDYQRPLLLEELLPSAQASLTVQEVARAYLVRLRQARREEIARGMTLTGPHRDDVHFLVDGVDLTLYGSRGQQRTTALALRFAEVDLMRQTTGESPVLLLDDVMSELDAGRRARVTAMVGDVEQCIITTTDWDDFTDAFRDRAAGLLRVVDGQVEPV